MTIDALAGPDWERLKTVPSDRLVPVREELHYAAQIPAALGRCYADPEPDDGHTTLRFRASMGSLVSRPSKETGVRAGLNIAEEQLVFLNSHGGIADTFRLKGVLMDDAWRWLRQRLEACGEDPAQLNRDDRGYELPPLHLQQNEPFEMIYPPAAAELARCYANAERVLARVSATVDNASRVRTWPHKFDSAVLVSLNPGEQPEGARSVGVGMMPGDGEYQEPYWYVTPWPYPKHNRFPDLRGGGTWHTEEWVGALLPLSKLEDGDSQPEQVAEFIESAYTGSRALVA